MCDFRRGRMMDMATCVAPPRVPTTKGKAMKHMWAIVYAYLWHFVSQLFSLSLSLSRARARGQWCVCGEYNIIIRPPSPPSSPSRFYIHGRLFFFTQQQPEANRPSSSLERLWHHGVVDGGDELHAEALRHAQHHHPVLDGRAVPVCMLE